MLKIGPAIDVWLSAKKIIRRGIFYSLSLSAFSSILQLSVPLYSMLIFNKVLPSGSMATLGLISMLLFLTLFCSVLIEGARNSVLARAGYCVDEKIRDFFTKSFFIEGAKNNQPLKDVDALRNFFCGQALPTILDAPFCVVFIGAIFVLHPWLGLITIAAIFSSLMLSVGEKRFVARRLNVINKNLHQFEFIAQNNFSKFDVVVAMGSRGLIIKKLTSINNKINLAMLNMSEICGWIDASGRSLKSIAQGLLLAIAAYLVLEREMQAGALIATSMLFGRVMNTTEKLSASYSSIVATRAAVARIRKLLDNSSQFECSELPILQGYISANNVSVRSINRHKPILNNLNFTINQGDFIAVVGREGAGKTTLARLLAGAEQPSSGIVRFDDYSLVRFKEQDFGFQVGYLPESQQLGYDKVSQIIGRGYSDLSAVVDAAKLSGADLVIRNLQFDYNTFISDDTCQLTAGARQRIALARAFFGKPKILILDEPTTHLDHEGEAILLKALKHFHSVGTTIVAISRHAGIQNLANRMMILEDGNLEAFVSQAEIHDALRPKLVSAVQ